MILLSTLMAGANAPGLSIIDLDTDKTIRVADSHICYRVTSLATTTWTFDRTLPRGAQGEGIQASVGAIQFAAEAGAPDIQTFLDFTRTAGIAVRFAWLCTRNNDGNSAEIVVSGILQP